MRRLRLGELSSTKKASSEIGCLNTLCIGHPTSPLFTSQSTRESTASSKLTSYARSSSDEILQTTFAHAKLSLRTIVKPQDFESLFPPSNAPNAQHVSSHTTFDVQRCLRDAQASYECRIGHAADIFQTTAPTGTGPISTIPTTPLSKSKAKARIWLTGLSEKLVHCGNIFDVMVQHHPEYVSLAWGTFKLLFVVGIMIPIPSIPHFPNSRFLELHQLKYPAKVPRQSPITPKRPRNSANPSPKSLTSSRSTRCT